jgi:3D (Asp-Asp-Asp) domain-containing protein
MISWAVVLIVGILLGFLLSAVIFAGDKPVESTDSETASMVTETSVNSTSTVSTEPTKKLASLGIFKITAYCPCEKCCGKWGKNRPTDENGQLIVNTASGELAVQGVTIAADTDVLPYGTSVMIDGHEYIVQDKGVKVKGNQIDIYFKNHQDAVQFGVQYKEIFIIERMNEND